MNNPRAIWTLEFHIFFFNIKFLQNIDWRVKMGCSSHEFVEFGPRTVFMSFRDKHHFFDSVLKNSGQLLALFVREV